MRVKYELLRCTFVEVPVTGGRFLQGQHRDICRLRDIHLVMQNGRHQLPVVAEHGTLSRSEAVELGPTQTDSQAKHAFPGVGVLGGRIVCHVPEVDSAVDCIGFEAKGQAEHVSNLNICLDECRYNVYG